MGRMAEHDLELEPPGVDMNTAPLVYQAIVNVIADLGKEGIGKTRKNQQQGYSFRGIDDVYEAVSPCLAKHKLCILPRVLARQVTEKESRSGGALFYVVLDVEFDLVSAEDGSKHTIRAAGEAMDSGDKATNKAMSAAFKYACMQAFCIPTEGDNDADSTTHEVRSFKTSPHPSVEYVLDPIVVRENAAAIRRCIISQNAKDAYNLHLELNDDLTMYDAVNSHLTSIEKLALRSAVNSQGTSMTKVKVADDR